MPVNTDQEMKAVQNEIIETISDICGINKIGIPSGNEEASINFAGGKCTKHYLDGSDMFETELRILKKSADQFTAAECIWNICNMLSGTLTHRINGNNKCKIYFVSVIEMPSLLKKDDDGTWIYSCTVSIKYYLRSRKELMK